MCHTPSVHPFLFHRGCGGGVAVLPQETLTSVCICCLVASLLCSATRRSGRHPKTAKQTRRVAALCLQLELDPSPSCCGIEPLTAVCVMAVGAQRGTIQLFLYQETGLDLTGVAVLVPLLTCTYDTIFLHEHIWHAEVFICFCVHLVSLIVYTLKYHVLNIFE